MTTLDRDRSRAGWLRPTARGLTPASVELAASTKRSGAGSTAPTVAFRMDEAAALLHPVAPVRVGLDILGGLLAMLILPGPTCVAWVAGGLTVEIWGWFATRTQKTPDGELIATMRDATEERARAEELEETRRTRRMLSEAAGMSWVAGCIACACRKRRIALHDVNDIQQIIVG